MRRHDGLAAALALFFCCVTARADEEDLARARYLDQQGVHAFADGHVRDAMALFWASYRAGGPPTELWNVARCQLKLEDSDGARRTLESYLRRKLEAGGEPRLLHTIRGAVYVLRA